MKVILEAQYACTPTPRGPGYYTFQLIRQLLRRKRNQYELTFFDGNREMNNRQWIDKYFGEFHVPVHECNSLNYRTAMYARDAFKARSYNDFTGADGDVFHFFNYTFPDNIRGKTIVTIYDMTALVIPEMCHPSWKHGFQILLERLEKRRPVIITISESTKKDILSYAGIDPEQIYVIPLGFDEEARSSKANPHILSQLGIDSPYMLFLGGMDMHKNMVRMLEAFEAMANRFPDIKLVLAGNPTPDHSEPIIDRIKASPCYGSRVLMLGYVTEEQKDALYANALAFLFPSLYEGFGLPVLEAMARGCPVITSNVASLPEVAGDAAILIDPYNVDQLAYEMERIVSSESLRQELKEKGLEQSKKFSWDKTAAMTEDVYRIAAEMR